MTDTDSNIDDLPRGGGCESCGAQVSPGRYREGLCPRCFADDDPPFTPEQMEWLEANIRDIVAEALVELAVVPVDEEDETDDPDPCPECGADRVREMGSTDPVCIQCDR